MQKIQLKTRLCKIGFGFLFVAVLPSLLILWAKYTESLIHLPVPGNLLWGDMIMLAGLLLVITGMHHLWFYGDGLPMNAFPPKKFVKKGIYALMANPIYAGVVLISFGLSIRLQSSSGFWLVSPLFALMTVAYTIGFENERTLKIFGPQKYRSYLSFSPDTEERPTLKDRLAVYFVSYVPWMLVYEAFIFTGVPDDAITTNMPFENEWPVIEFTALFYIVTYLFVLLVPFSLATKKELRSLEIDIWVATLLTGIIYFSVPFIVEQRPFTSYSYWGKILLFDRSQDGSTAALPAFHVIWSFIAARYFAKGFPKLKVFWYLFALLIAVSCLTTGNHSLLDVIAGYGMFLITVYRNQLWNYIRYQSERLANSWVEWRFGPVRIINHGFYAGAAGFVGALVSGFFMGSHYAFSAFFICVMTIIGAGLWAQFIEGSPKLQRPFGYYGGVIGATAGCAIVTMALNANFYLLFASFAIGAPWIQILGRLRCLVQGCCHGKPSPEYLGIRFTHPYSRVNKISGLKGLPLHPTQLYSIGTNLITGLVLIRLVSIGMSATFITGIYFILNGLGRFVEEYFRGEAQTPYWAGMRIYQWIAIISIIFGASYMNLSDTKMTPFLFNIESLFWALGLGIFAVIAYGVDFPTSNRRFARLTSA